MKEKDFQRTFNHWVKEVYKKTAAFELKYTKTDSLPFSVVAGHQEDALMQVKHGVFVFKIPDMGYQNPYDCFCLSYQKAFIVIKYLSFFCLIDIDVWVEEQKISYRKSLTSKRAREIAYLIVDN